MQTKTIYAPTFFFLIFLVGIELCVRLPFVITTMNSPASGQVDRLHFFSIYDQGSVMMLGLLLVSIAFVIILTTNLMTPVRIKVPLHQDIPNVPASLYLVCVLVTGATLWAISSLGAEALLTSFSSKRADLGDRGLVWLLVKIGNFNHMLILMLYLRYLKYGQRLDQFMMVVSFLALAALSMVFSQRALLVSLVLGLFYVALLYGKLRLRTVLTAVLSVALVVTLISAFRPGTAFGSNTEILQEGLRRALMARYFFDFAKLGTVLHWADAQSWLGPIVIGFVLEPFFGNDVLFYKEIGPMLSDQVYMYRFDNGVTPGLLLESILSFGYVVGFLFFGAVIQTFRVIEARFFQHRGNSLLGVLLPVLLLSKFSLVLNSSLGAFAFQVVLDGTMLLAALFLMRVLSVRQTTRPAMRHVPG